MMLKVVFLAFMAVAVMADDSVDSKQQQLNEMLTQQCKNNNAEDKVPEVKNAIKTFAECITNLINMQQLSSEIEAAKPNGALDEVFKKYCEKSPQFKTCIHNLMDSVSPCIDTSAREQLTSGKNSTDQLIDFLCYKDGDRIALFIAEGGPECFRSKADDLKVCADNLKGSFKNVDDAKKLTTVEKCGKFDELTSCLVTKLESCSKPTPANMAEALFKYIRKVTPCNTALPK